MTPSTTIPTSIKQQLLTEFCAQHDDAIFTLDANMCYVSVNPAYEMMIGFDQDFLLGRPLAIYASEFLLEEERVILEEIFSCLQHEGIYENEFSMAPRYGQTLEWHMICRKVCVDEDVYYVGMARDISAVVNNKKQVAHLLNFNQLTGLPNRKFFSTQASRSLLKTDQKVFIVRLNIDGYRILANTLGSDNINALVKQFVDQVYQLDLDNLRCFSHFGGDDFALLFEGNDIDILRKQFANIMQICEHAFSIEGHLIYLHISIGISYAPFHGKKLSTLLNQAEKALQYIKQQGGDDICWYNQDLHIASLQSLKLETELRQALAEHQFELYYQPNIKLDTGKINGFEALVRWQHPIRGLLQPVDFIDDIIRYKLSFELFCQMAVQIVKQLLLWQSLGFNQSISINADAAEFVHPKFFDFVTQLLTEYDIQAHHFHIEITESSLMLRNDIIKQKLTKLKALGICLALDDFGTGYSSLSYLQEYPFDFIKIDRSFISAITTNHTQHAIVKAILDLTIALDMRAIAEGIETKEQLELLEKMNCAYGQGYLFSKPVTANAATKMLTSPLPA